MSPKLYTVSPKEAERILSANAALGLSRKAARLAYGKKRLSGERDFYFVPKRSVFLILLSRLSDFSFWLLLLCMAVFAFFETMRPAILCVIVLLIHLVLSIVMEKYASSIRESLAFSSAPKTRIIREGRLFVIDSRCVVRGDTVLLRAGDMVPFDARLMTSSSLRVSVLTDIADDGSMVYRKCDKNADAILPAGRDLPPEEQVNMLTAGSVILSGSARAIVSETGDFTYMGALCGGIAARKREEKSPILECFLKTVRLVGFVMLLCTIPLTAASYFLSGLFGDASLSVSFLTILALSAAFLSDWMLTLADLGSMRFLWKKATEERIKNRVLFKTACAAEQFAEADALLLFDRSMLTDGYPHVAALSVGGGLYEKNNLLEADCIPLAEKVSLMCLRSAALPSVAPSEKDVRRKSFLAYADALGVDREMLSIRYHVTEYRSPFGEEQIESMTYHDEKGVSHLLVASPSEEMLSRCASILKKGSVVPFTDVLRTRIEEQCRKWRKADAEIVFYIEKTDHSGPIFHGFVAYTPEIPRETSAHVAALREAGLSTILFLEEEREEDLLFAYRTGIVTSDSEIARASRFKAENHTIDTDFGSYRLYLGFSREEIAALLLSLESSQVITVGVGMERGTAPLLRLTTISVVPGTFDVRSRRRTAQKLDELPVCGVSVGTEGSEKMQYDADALLSRAGRNGGGLSALLHALSATRRMMHNREAFFGFLFLSLALRLGWILPLLSDLRNLSPAVMLSVSGLFTDLVLGLSLIFTPATSCAPKQPKTTGVLSFLSLMKYRMILGAASGFSVSLVAVVLSCFGLDSIAASYRILAHGCAHLTFFLCAARRLDSSAPTQHHIGHASILGLSLLLIFLIPPLRPLLGLSAFSPLALCLAPLGVLIPLLISRLLRKNFFF